MEQKQNEVTVIADETLEDVSGGVVINTTNNNKFICPACKKEYNIAFRRDYRNTAVCFTCYDKLTNQ